MISCHLCPPFLLLLLESWESKPTSGSPLSLISMVFKLSYFFLQILLNSLSLQSVEHWISLHFPYFLQVCFFSPIFLIYYCCLVNEVVLLSSWGLDHISLLNHWSLLLNAIAFFLFFFPFYILFCLLLVRCSSICIRFCKFISFLGVLMEDFHSPFFLAKVLFSCGNNGFRLKPFSLRFLEDKESIFIHFIFNCSFRKMKSIFAVREIWGKYLASLIECCNLSIYCSASEGFKLKIWFVHWTQWAIEKDVLQ